ncbi:putative short-chain dehydrogenase [Daldinia vernicosa]|uniref:putative short-chain dehydrogenase n=1 Tax=Daldinia vernicosa TaxID=114800 RepID=UPI002007AD8C|nr:putative short-chain dehydrogenase [Daldinia vernicosa]KAI0846830.1 putative short-chain dehydrogenase [Daldinia vernicosa]
MNYTKTQHTKPYGAISPSLPHLSTASKSVFIVGGSAGIGKATALAFLASGSRRIALTGRREAVLAATAAELQAKYADARVLTFAVDVVDEAGTQAAFSKAKAEFGALDVVVNAAGVQTLVKPLAEADLEAWWKTFETGVRGAAVVARAAAGYAKPDAVVLYLATAGALFPANGGLPMSGYAASKLAAVKVMEYFGAENPGLRVVSVHPGVVTETEGGKKMVEDSGMEWPSDDINLPAHFLVWAASKEAEFLKNKFVFAAWDVDELKARKDEIAQSPELLLGLNGFPRSV